MADKIKIFAIGDIVGRVGRHYLASKLPGFCEINGIDLVIANAENAAGGFALSSKVAEEVFNAGVDIITSGNHIWDNKDILKIIDTEERLLRPANFPPGNPGKGFCFYNFKNLTVCVINLMGRVQMNPLDCPFQKFDHILTETKGKADIYIVDFHAEATAEKRAFGWYANKRAALVYGTHTHVQTADEEILSGGTGYITDIGMTGPFDSVIGMGKEGSIRRFVTQQKIKFEVATSQVKINGILAVINSKNQTEKIERIVF